MSKIKYLVFVSIILAYSCSSKQKDADLKPAVIETKVKHTDWSKSAVIYEVNIRQYTPEGTFNAFTAQIPKLKELGVDILWIMPINPIGEKNRKGTLGSYYSVKDYMAVNPAFGTIDDFKNLVKTAHNAGMHVIIDWVANHTAWDNVWMTDHYGWYEKDSTGKPFGPYDWTDVAKLDYKNDTMRAEMVKALEFWVKNTDIDGYRCDVAGLVPVDFWEDVRKKLDEIKPVFMLAEAEDSIKLLNNAFDMNYNWSGLHLMNNIGQGKANVKDIKGMYVIEDSIYSKDCYRMNFITNHDENTWSGTEFERYGDGAKTFAVMTFTVPGMPLIYTGQEVGMKKRLSFFEKDTVPFVQNEYVDFYKSLVNLKHQNEMFWNGAAGGDFVILDANNDSIFAFKRFTPMKDAFVILNLSAKEQNYTIPKGMAGAYTEYFSGESTVMDESEQSQLKPWEYKVYIEK